MSGLDEVPVIVILGKDRRPYVPTAKLLQAFGHVQMRYGTVGRAGRERMADAPTPKDAGRATGDQGDHLSTPASPCRSAIEVVTPSGRGVVTLEQNESCGQPCGARDTADPFYLAGGQLGIVCRRQTTASHFEDAASSIDYGSS
jgi:hypothetical protein